MWICLGTTSSVSLVKSLVHVCATVTYVAIWEPIHKAIEIKNVKVGNMNLYSVAVH